MSKYISIKESLVVDSGTAEIVVGTTASAAITTGTNTELGQVNTVSAVGGTNNGGYTTATGVATTGGGNNDCTVDIVANGTSVTSFTVNAKGTGYSATNSLTISGGGANATFTVDSVGNLGSNAQILNATGIGIGVVPGDVVYNISASTQANVLLRVSNNQLTFATSLFPLGGETVATRKLNQLNAVSTFTTRKVRVGDIVKNTTASTQTTVAALVSETSLTLASPDIFNSSALFNDNFTIEAPANEVYDNGQNFVTTVSPGDEVFDTTDNTSGIVSSVLDNFRLRLGTNLLAIGDNFTIYSQTGGLPRFIPVDGIVFINAATTTTTDIFMDGDWKITLTHDTVAVLQSGVVKSFQNAQLRAITAAGGAETVVLPPRIYVTEITVA